MIMFIPIFGGKKYNELTSEEKRGYKRNVLIFELIGVILGMLFLADVLIGNNTMFILPGVGILIFTALIYWNTKRLS